LLFGFGRALLLAFEFTELFVVHSSRQPAPKLPLFGLLLALSLAAAAARSSAQTPPPPTPDEPVVSAQAADAPTPDPAATAAAAEADATQKRLARARSLAAIGKLAASAAELESVRAATKDESVRDVARVLLMAVFVEMPDYPRAELLLEETFKARGTGQAGDASTHFYFALAGQTVNAVRTHLERYRSFGVNVSDATELPPDAASDIEQLRRLLERVVEEAKALHAEQLKGGSDGARGLDAAALLEDAATVRMRIARHDQDRALWQSEISEARQHLFSSEMRIASLSEVPAARSTPQPLASAAKSSAPAGSTQPARTESKGSDSSQKNSKKSGQPSNEQSNRAASTNAQSPAQQPAGAAGATAPSAGGPPVAVGSLVAKARSRVSPSYPAIARAARVTGSVTVFLVVNEKGEVESVQRADGPMQLQQAAIEAARRWKFNATVINGQPVRISGYLNFSFAL
jgi:TonB family protein